MVKHDSGMPPIEVELRQKCLAQSGRSNIGCRISASQCRLSHHYLASRNSFGDYLTYRCSGSKNGAARYVEQRAGRIIGNFLALAEEDNIVEGNGRACQPVHLHVSSAREGNRRRREIGGQWRVRDDEIWS